jgi:hypothetical protein
MLRRGNVYIIHQQKHVRNYPALECCNDIFSLYLVLYRCAFFSDKSTNVTELEAVSSQYIDTDTYNIPSKYSDGGAKSWSDSFFNDMYAKRGYIFGFGLGISLFLSFFYLYFLRIPGVLSLIIWTIIISKPP